MFFRVIISFAKDTTGEPKVSKQLLQRRQPKGGPNNPQGQRSTTTSPAQRPVGLKTRDRP
jgi:hypothetical protein